jgi:rhamnopyranosyl-N-acetylglucosaminyl-diphospho-decaprenol beta-1,3/1,4-galactofuranosyltransferase
MNACVVAAVATFRRSRELARLLSSLHGIEHVIVCNNASDPEVRTVCEKAMVSTTCLDSSENLGCGGGLRLAEEEAWKRFGDRLTHLLVLDDDAVLEPDTVPRLVEVLERERAAVVYPLVTGADGLVGWTPGLKDPLRHKLGGFPMPVSDYRKSFAGNVAEFDWAQGICLLAKRESVDASGFHRADFWVRGEDLDFSLRLTANGRGVFTTEIVVKHLPPESSPVNSAPVDYLRHAAMVQNIAYLGIRQPHGRRIAKSLAGASRRFVTMWGIQSVTDLFSAIWRGGILAEPAGKGNGRTFQQRFQELINR